MSISNKFQHMSPKKKFFGSLLVFSLTPPMAHAAIEEIIVTANKRAENANDIGMSISAISGTKLAEQKLTSLEEITSSVPGLTYATSQQNTPILTLRGVGFNESSLGVYPATSLYVDEIPLPFPVMAAHSAYDLERAEVLKGPQGVLFGQNSTGGAVNFIAKKPSAETAYGFDASYGTFNKIEANGYVNGGLTDTVSARLAVQKVQADEWQKSVTRPGDENGEEDYTAARLQFLINPSENAEINININGWQDKSDPLAMQYIAATPKRYDQAAELANDQFHSPLASEDARDADWSPLVEPEGDKEFMQYSVRGDFDLTDTKKLTGILAYSDYEQNQVQDGDGSALVLADFFHNKGEIDSTFAEIRLSSDEDAMRWVVGANYEDSSTFEDQHLVYLDNTTYRPQSFYLHNNGDALEQEIESFAFFGNIDFDITETLTAKAGARYTDTTIDASSCNYATPNLDDTTDRSRSPAAPSPNDDGSNVAAIFNYLGSLSGRAFTPIGIGDCFTLDAPPGQGVPGALFEDTLAEDNISWRAGLDYQASEDALVYATVSQGYKAGSYPVLAANDYTQLQPVTEESVLAYEAGYKMSLLESRVQWNGAVFYYDYQDKQERGKIDIPLFGPLDRLVNVPESTITGFETDVVAELTEGLTLTAAITYLDSEIKKYGVADGAYDVYGNLRELSGGAIPFTPEFAYNLDLDYRTALGNGGTLFMGVNILGQDETNAVIDGENLSLADSPARSVNGVLLNGQDAGYHKAITENYFMLDSFATVGARLGYETAGGNWRVMLWGKNLTDEYYWNSVVASSENGARIAARPRTLGVTVGYDF